MQSRDQSKRKGKRPMMAKSRRVWLGHGRSLATPVGKGLSPYCREGVASLRELGELRVSKMSSHTFWTLLLGAAKYFVVESQDKQMCHPIYTKQNYPRKAGPHLESLLSGYILSPY